MQKFTIDDVELVLTRPVEQDVQWIGQEDLVDQVLAAWLVVHESDQPLCPRLVGKPGVGKTTLAYAAARSMGLDAYIHQCTVDTRPEDLLVTPVLSRDGKISYHASSLVSAMVRGGVAILDEANRMSEKSWASLAPLLDHRRYVESIVAGIRIPAHPSFRACITMNEDASTYEIPDYMLSRIQPEVEIQFPERDDEFQILKYHLPFAPDEILELTVDFLQGGHRHGLGYSTRDGINIVRYALKMAHQVREAAGEGVPARRGRGRAAKTGAASGGAALADWKAHFQRSVQRILGEDALDLKKSSLKKEPVEYVDLREFFAAVDDLRSSNAAEQDADEKEDGEGDEGEKGEGREDPDARPRRPDRGGKPRK